MINSWMPRTLLFPSPSTVHSHSSVLHNVDPVKRFQSKKTLPTSIQNTLICMCQKRLSQHANTNIILTPFVIVISPPLTPTRNWPELWPSQMPSLEKLNGWKWMKYGSADRKAHNDGRFAATIAEGPALGTIKGSKTPSVSSFLLSAS